ncbi:serine hydrolase domain-containing protein [Maricaulis sp.]|uniref:serine hydrolase domain-containing protein n=1 Tax=Maricaulis sp. TaxID=1486257 RepID=UPI002612DBE0|nr:serine hydrolase domain-containing protein [Maricaulis sp.]
MIASLLSAGFLAATALTTQPAGQHAAAQEVFDALAESFPALNATVMVEGEIVWEAEGGLARDAGDSVEQDYNFYSIAKMLTGMAYARLEAESGLDLDQSIRLIDTGLPVAYDGITLRQLLSHTGGVRHYQGERDWRRFNDRRCATPEDALGHFIDDRLIAAPGERHQYTTFGFALLSHLLVEITGADSYDAAMHAVLGDVYMARTDREGVDKAVTYMGEAGAFDAIALSAECKFGGGGLLASSRDLAAMGAAFAAGEVIATERFSQVLTAQTLNDGTSTGMAYGMGVGYWEELGSHYATHSGGSPGGRGFLLVLADLEIVVALTANFDGPQHADTAIALGQYFARTYAGIDLPQD